MTLIYSFQRSLCPREKLYEKSIFGLWTKPYIEGIKALANLNPHHKGAKGEQQRRTEKGKSAAVKSDV